MTQLYDTGAAVYIYFGFLYKGLADPVQTYSDIEDAAREEILKNGGCISHHHGNFKFFFFFFFLIFMDKKIINFHKLYDCSYK